MGRCFIQVVCGPAGSGKSTYCETIQRHCETLGKISRRRVHVANLDPAAENFKYDVAFDIRDLITVEDVMEELGLGPNGALIYCMEYLIQNMDWLEDNLEKFDDDEYLLLDCPGQIELYTHVPIMKGVIETMSMWGFGSRMASVFLVDASFVCDAPKFISGSLLSLSAMIALELPHINILSKCDLVDDDKIEDILDVHSATELWQKEEYNIDAQEESVMKSIGRNDNPHLGATLKEERRRVLLRRKKHNRLTKTICDLLDDYSMVSFIPLDASNEDSISNALAHVDHSIQYGEDVECRGAEEDDNDGETDE